MSDLTTESLDPLPYHCMYGPECRHKQKLAPSTVFAPRPGFSQNREDYHA